MSGIGHDRLNYALQLLLSLLEHHNGGRWEPITDDLGNQPVKSFACPIPIHFPLDCHSPHPTDTPTLLVVADYGNAFIKDHGLKAVAIGDLVAKVRKGLAALHVVIDDTPVRVYVQASVVIQALRMAQALQILLTEAATGVELHNIPTCKQSRLTRACTTTLVILHLFFSRSGAGIVRPIEELVASKEDGIRKYRRTGKR
jgi:hypothetical protein